MTLDEIRECLAAEIATRRVTAAALRIGLGAVQPCIPEGCRVPGIATLDNACDAFEAALAAYTDDRARTIAHVLEAEEGVREREEHARAEAVRALLAEAERFCVDGGRWADCAHPDHGDLEAAIARVRALFPGAK